MKIAAGVVAAWWLRSPFCSFCGVNGRTMVLDIDWFE
jgi:hypothetical protein